MLTLHIQLEKHLPFGKPILTNHIWSRQLKRCWKTNTRHLSKTRNFSITITAVKMWSTNKDGTVPKQTKWQDKKQGLMKFLTFTFFLQKMTSKPVTMAVRIPESTSRKIRRPFFASQSMKISLVKAEVSSCSR